MATIFEQLPGLDVPVAKVLPTLSEIWETGPERVDAPSAFRASQMTLLLHFGLGTTVEEAQRQFDVALRFAQRYPCRIVVVCPEPEAGRSEGIRAKVFAECFIGSSRHDMVCCEAILLTYGRETRQHLESLVSTLLESDLPVYYWPHHFFFSRRIQDYLFFVQTAKRIIVDTAVDGEDVLAVPWPKPEAVKDLVYGRILSVRQTLGQFLSAFGPELIVEGLRSVSVVREAALRPEARVLLRWLHDRLEACAVVAGRPGLDLAVEERESVGGGQGLEVVFAYAGAKSLRWEADLGLGRAVVEAEFGQGRVTLPATCRLLAPEAALAEAMFF